MKGMEIALLSGLALFILLYEFGSNLSAPSVSPSTSDETSAADPEPLPASQLTATITAAPPVTAPTLPAGTSQPTQVADDDRNLEAEYDRINTNPDYPSLAMRLTEVSSRRAGQTHTARDLLDALRRQQAWATDDEEVAGHILTAQDRHDGRVFIRIDRSRIEALVAGDELTLPLHQENRNYTLYIDGVEVGEHDEVTWRGHLTDFPADNQVTITQGGRLTLAGITTPSGHYLVEARQGQGWIAASGDLFKQDFSQSDEIYPERQAGAGSP